MRRELGIAAITALLVGCGGESVVPSDEFSVLELDQIDTLISTESALISWPTDIAVAPDGDIYVADSQGDRLVRLQPSGTAPTTIGRQGKGPSEFDGPSVVRAGESVVVVVDRGNGRIQRLERDGRFIGSTLLGPHTRVARPWLEEDGSLVIGTMGRQSALAVQQDSLGTVSATYGAPVVEPWRPHSVTAIKAQIARGEIPDEFRNDVLVARDGTGAVWILLQSDGVIRRYDPSGTLLWQLEPVGAEMAEILDTFFRENEAETRPNFFFPLRYFADLQPVGNELWVLLARSSEQPATLFRISSEGLLAGQIDVPPARGSRSFAYDEDRSLLYLGTAEDAQVVVAAVE